ncbi:CBS domain-containing protein [Mycolicibacterium septicum]|uniref:CBS domain-containing protein n=1 Tax=Mycolicibacterium septicum TaxID=98668 RepID=UPI0023E0D3F6|nr:CBS domain-containing protein [Mycolicibacterium septicum]MDF3340716.1 CBS domain-containing protein [Mycolicibacterium septicum]
MVNVLSAGSISVADLVGDAVIRVPHDATVAMVAEAIAEAGVGAVVVGDEVRPVALVSERDVIRVVAAHRDPTSMPAVDVASTNLVWCEASDTVEQVAVRMTDRHIRHILVENSGVLVGIVSARDLLGVYAAEADPEP